MSKQRLTPQDLDARLKFILGCTLGAILLFTALGILYALIFVTQPIEHSQKMTRCSLMFWDQLQHLLQEHLLVY
jgi:hypothetical protein